MSMKKIISITIDSELADSLEKYAKSSAKYRNKSHIVEIAVLELMKKERVR